MRALILGKNAINAKIEKYLSCEGIDTVTIPDVSEIVKINGEPGSFVATTHVGMFGFSAVIITEPPQFAAPVIDGEAATNLMDGAETDRLCDLKSSEKIVILLDYVEETGEYIAAEAIYLARQFAAKKKEVVFLSKTVKSGYGGGELRYQEARDAGVRFIKYDSISLSYDKETDSFNVKASDGVFDLDISTPYVLSAVDEEGAELKAISKKLRLRAGADGRILDGMFFLYPVFQAKRGVYYFNPALVLPDDGQNMKRAMRSIAEDMAAIEAEGYIAEIVRGWQLPEVDPGKCAFCYSCYRACPHGALEPDMEAAAMKVVESACQACGTCIAICPGEAIARKGPGRHPAGAGKSRIYCCENGAAAAFEDALPLIGGLGQTIDCERVACGGSVGVDMIAADLKYYDTIIVACCIEDACRHLDGDKRACKQVFRAAEILQKAGLENKSVHAVKVSHTMKAVLSDNILNILEGKN